MSWRKPADAFYQDHPHRQHRPLELLALRLHRCGHILRKRLTRMGIFRSYNMLHHHPYTCRYDGQEVSVILQGHGRHIHTAAVLRRFRAVCMDYQQGPR